MNRLFGFPHMLILGPILLSGSVIHAESKFSEFSPLDRSAPPTLDEALPMTFGNPDFLQISIAERNQQLLKGRPNTGAWDMLTVNLTADRSEDVGRYLFTVFENEQAGVQRHDLKTGETQTIWQSLAPNEYIAFDASYWTPWGTFITAEENWTTAPEGTKSPFGRLFELKNPLEAPGIEMPLSATSNSGAVLVHQNVIPRTSHEGIQFDAAGHLYFIDELNGGSIYMYVSAASMSDVKAKKADYFAAGQTFVLRVGDGNTPNATGVYSWVPLTDSQGLGLPGAIINTDSNGIKSVDARNTTDLANFKGTDYQRPEDLQLQVVDGKEYLYVATTTTHEVYRLDLAEQKISVFADRKTLDLATGKPVDAEFTNPDNLAIDHEGNIYIVEDRPGGVDDDIWFARDLNHDGDLNDEGEGLARWASNGTVGSEFTGLYFDPFKKDRAWVNIQHPTSGNDRTMEIRFLEDTTQTAQ